MDATTANLQTPVLQRKSGRQACRDSRKCRLGWQFCFRATRIPRLLRHRSRAGRSIRRLDRENVPLVLGAPRAGYLSALPGKAGARRRKATDCPAGRARAGGSASPSARWTDDAFVIHGRQSVPAFPVINLIGRRPPLGSTEAVLPLQAESFWTAAFAGMIRRDAWDPCARPDGLCGR